MRRMSHKASNHRPTTASLIAGLRTRHPTPLLLDRISGYARGGRALAPDAYRRILVTAVPDESDRYHRTPACECAVR